METAPVPDVLVEGLAIVFVGYNPGRVSSRVGHHFAGPGNLFWSLLYDSGLTDQRLTPERDRELPFWGIGLTNLVDRPTASASELTSEERRQGAGRLAAKLARYRPQAVAFLGKDLYRAYRGGLPGAAIPWGRQPPVDSAPPLGEWVLPNPSRRSTLAYGERLRYFLQLRAVAAAGHGGRDR